MSYDQPLKGFYANTPNWTLPGFQKQNFFERQTSKFLDWSDNFRTKKENFFDHAREGSWHWITTKWDQAGDYFNYQAGNDAKAVADDILKNTPNRLDWLKKHYQADLQDIQHKAGQLSNWVNSLFQNADATVPTEITKHTDTAVNAVKNNVDTVLTNATHHAGNFFHTVGQNLSHLPHPTTPAEWAATAGVAGLAAVGGYLSKGWLAKHPQAAETIEKVAVTSTKNLSKVA
jgi:hypothetical protein